MAIHECLKGFGLTGTSVNMRAFGVGSEIATGTELLTETFQYPEEIVSETQRSESPTLYITSHFVEYALLSGIRSKVIGLDNLRFYLIGEQPKLWGENVLRLQPPATSHVLKPRNIRWNWGENLTSVEVKREFETPESIAWYWRQDSPNPNRVSISERIDFLAKEARLDEEDEALSLDSLRDLLTFLDAHIELPRPSLTINPAGLLSATWDLVEEQNFELIIRFSGYGQVDALLTIKHVSLLSDTERCALKNVPHVLVLERLKPYRLFSK